MLTNQNHRIYNFSISRRLTCFSGYRISYCIFCHLPNLFDHIFTLIYTFLFFVQMAVGSFRSSVWDPSTILCQIVCLQSSFYSFEGSLMFLWSLFTSYRPLLLHFFFSRALHPMVLIQLVASILCAFLFPFVIGRARLCLDFVVTLHFVHFLIVCLYNRTFPSQFSWWLLQVLSASLCTILAEWLCSRREYAEIPLTQGQANALRPIDT